MNRKYVILSILIVLAAFGTGAAYAKRAAILDWIDARTKTTDLPEAVDRDTAVNRNTNAAPANVNAANGNANTNAPTNTNTAPAPLPAEMNLKVPFTSQAPHANWDLPYQEACEEAAAIMVNAFWQNQTFANANAADRQILALVDFEEQHYGSYKDTTATETARFIRDMWSYHTVDVYTGGDVTIDRMTREVANGYPVIVLAAGRQLGNPNFTGDGPLYHALVVKGYTKSGLFITNDPGTRKGADYVYNQTVLYNAIHDWNDGDVANGQKAMIVIRPNAP